MLYYYILYSALPCKAFMVGFTVLSCSITLYKTYKILIANYIVWLYFSHNKHLFYFCLQVT